MFLSEILDRQDCGNCRFCCSFRRASIWETPVFTQENLEAIGSAHPEYLKELKTFEYGGGTYARYDLTGKYVSDREEEEVPCPFLNPSAGCVLSPEEKPWDCSIWPLRVVKRAEGEQYVALTPTCSTISRLGIEAVRNFVDGQREEYLLDYAARHPFLYKDDKRGFLIRL